MMNLGADEVVNTRLAKRFDLPFESTEVQRRRMLESRISFQRGYRPVGGTSAINTFKDTYDVLCAEGKAEIARYERSWLWSPSFRPSDLRRFVFYPLLFAGGVSFLIVTVAMNRHRVRLRQRGVGLPDSEAALRANGWLPEYYHDEFYGDLFRAPPSEPLPAPTRIEALTELERARPHRARLQKQMDNLAAERLQRRLQTS